jgi:hypothetical protein
LEIGTNRVPLPQNKKYRCAIGSSSASSQTKSSPSALHVISGSISIFGVAIVDHALLADFAGCFRARTAAFAS